jgi:PleD family two-component response regulator
MTEATANPLIMIVEDDLDLAEMLSAYLRVQNYDIVTAAWGREAVQMSENEHLSLILLDIRLPDIDGYEVCRQIRTNRRTQDVPIIFLTEKRDRVDKLQGLELGVVDYITKPFDIQEVRLRVRNALNRIARLGMSNPVTDLPEMQVTEDRLNGLVLSDEDWAVVLVSLERMASFREHYGFVAADDVMRAVTLMVRNAVKENSSEEAFIGHAGPEDFLIITTPSRASFIRDRSANRIRQSSEYFLPVKDRERLRAGETVELIGVRASVITKADGPFVDGVDIRQRLVAGAVSV